MQHFPKTPRLLTEFPKEWKHLRVIVEEKLDGANVALSVEDGQLILQSRNHIITGDSTQRQFEPFVEWAHERESVLRKHVAPHHIVFGEWLYATHRISYNMLPAHFIAYDVLDLNTGSFLPWAQRSKILEHVAPQPPILHQGVFGKVRNFTQFIGNSHFKTSSWKAVFAQRCLEAGVDPKGRILEVDDSTLMEGIYIRVESDTQVVARMKIPRPEFEKVRVDDSRWLTRPIVRNTLSDALL